MKFTTAALKFLVGVLRSPEGKTLVGAGLVSLSPPVGLLVQTWGTEGLASVLETWAGAEITEADMAKALAEKGFRVVPFDPAKLFG